MMIIREKTREDVVRFAFARIRKEVEQAVVSLTLYGEAFVRFARTTDILAGSFDSTHGMTLDELIPETIGEWRNLRKEIQS